MPWPLSQDYNEAIQTPAACFGDPELKQGEAVTNALGIPMPRSGNFADVYEFNCPATNKKWAVKCFTRQIPGLHERYVQINDYLQQVPQPFMVGFNFLEQGMRIRGDWYPILKMQWVEGFALNDFVKQKLDKPQYLELLCQIWVKMAKRLREASLAHCDLQHGNVLLVPGRKEGALAVKLVDYDGMCVPSLTLLKSIEMGHPNFQHPRRAKERIYNLEVDRFSHLVIYTALRALQVGGRPLWEKYDNGDNLLFKQADLEAPGKSALFAELLRLNDPTVNTLTDILARAAVEPLEEAPLVEELAGAGTSSATAVRAQPADTTVPSAAQTQTPAATDTTVAPAAKSADQPKRKWWRKPVKSWAAALIILAVVAAGTAGVGAWFLKTRKAPEQPVAARPAVPDLIAPLPGAVLSNRAVSWDFQWSEMPQARRYHLVIKSQEDVPPVLNNDTLLSPSFTYEWPSSILKKNQLTWRWKVRTLVNGTWSDWSEERMFNVQPLETGPAPSIPPVKSVVWSLSPSTTGFFGGRSGEIKQKLLEKYGGNEQSEAAVADGLKWLALHQAVDGHWSLNKIDQGSKCNCTGNGSTTNDVAATAFGLLPLLGAGSKHKAGTDKGNLYTKEVDRGLRWLILKQNVQGEFHSNMYAHGLASIAMCEAYGLTSDPALREPAQRCLNYIVEAQSQEGGWRYSNCHRGPGGYDGSISAWQFMALKTGQMAGLDVPTTTLQGAIKWLDAAQTQDGAAYGYTSPGSGPATSAGGLLCRQYLGWGLKQPALRMGVDTLHKMGPQRNYMYYSYYATQVMHHMGGDDWEKWNPKMRDALIAAQDKGDKNLHQKGSWYDPRDSMCSGHGGRLMQTSLSLLSLEVYYRHGQLDHSAVHPPTKPPVVPVAKVEPPATEIKPKPKLEPPALLLPAPGAVVDNGAMHESKVMAWDFQWSEVKGASQYHLRVSEPGQANPVLDQSTLTSPSYRHETRGYIANENRLGWRWQVRALVNGTWTDWSPERSFDVAPLILPKEITNSLGMKLVLIPKGKFLMGSPSNEKGRAPDEGPQHEVELTAPFYMGANEVTQEQYEWVMKTNPSNYSDDGGGKDKVKGLDTRRFPVEMVSWEDATVFCRKLSELLGEKDLGRVCRLPTEAEWEYACRAGTTTPFHFGNTLNSEQAIFDGNNPYGGGASKGKSPGRTAAAGSHPPNAFGLYDVHGNVAEWCADWHDKDYYANSPKQDPRGPRTGKNRVVRGGAWNTYDFNARAAARRAYAPGNRAAANGFRIVWSLSPSASPIERPATPVNKAASPADGQELLTIDKNIGSVYSVCFSPDGKRLASAGRDQVKVRNAVNGQELITLRGSDVGHSVCFSPDGKRLASAGDDNTVKVWNAVDGQELLTFKGHIDGGDIRYIIFSVCFSPDGRRLASGGQDRIVKIWNAASGQELLTLKGHTSNVYSICFSPDGKRLASASWDNTVKIWDAASGQELLTFKGHSGYVYSVCFSPDGKRLASAGSDQIVKVWNAASGQELFTLKGHIRNVVHSVCFSPDGKRLASASWEGTVKIWSVAGAQESLITPENKADPSAKQFTNSIGMKLVLIPKGKFTMGSPASEKDRRDNEGPQHEVEITKPFFVGVFEVTQEEYEQVIGTNPCDLKGAKHPVSQVGWNDAVEFCKKLSARSEEKRAGWTYRLLTEAEWEYACRAGSIKAYCFGEEVGQLGEYGRYKDNSGGKTHPVGSTRKPNAFGLYDMHGNVNEWCADWYDADYYKNSPRQDPENTKEAFSRVVRGGSWGGVGGGCRSAFRHGSAPGNRYFILGFRVAAVQSR